MLSLPPSTLRSFLVELEIDLATRTIAEPPPYACTAELWHDGGTFITDDALVWSAGPARAESDLGVLTRHARPLSWLFFALREAFPRGQFAGQADEYFGRLADAANAHLGSHQPEPDDWRPLLCVVLHEARRIEQERGRAPRTERAARPARARPRGDEWFQPLMTLTAADG